MATHKTLFIAPNRIGDAVLASSILAHILTTDRNARVTIATSPLAAPLYEGYPQLVRIIPVTKRSYNRHWLTLWRATFPTHWHAVWDMRNSILSYTLRMKHRHSYTSPPNDAPKVKQYEHSFGIATLPYPTLWPRTSDIAAAEALLPAHERYLVFAPIANWAPKEWPLSHFITLAKTLFNDTCKGYRPVIVCAGHEREKALPMLKALAPYRPIDLTHGNTHLLTIFACMQRAHGFIGNDSGLMHMAAAAQIPTLGLFGPTPSTIYQPWGVQTGFVCAPQKDLLHLTVDKVAAEFIALRDA